MQNLDAPGRLVIGGSNEAVLEVLISMRQALYIQIDRMSPDPMYMFYGVGPGEDLSIRPYAPSPIQDSRDLAEINTSLDSYELSNSGLSRRSSHTLFECSFNGGVKSDLMRAISIHHPEVLFFTDFAHGGSARCWIDGQKTHTAIPGGFGKDLDDKMASLPRPIVDALHDATSCIVAQQRAPRGSGPRWSSLTHAAHRAGALGLSRLVDGTPGLSLREDLQRAQAEARTSWLDALLFGDYGATAEEAVYPTACQEQWAHQQRMVLQHLHDELSDETRPELAANQLFEILSDPSATLQSGLHPLAFLASSAQSDRTTRPELMEVVTRLSERLASRMRAAQQPPNAKQFASAVCALVCCEGRHGTVSLALASGLDLTTLHRTIDANADYNWTDEEAHRLMSTYAECFGPIPQFPEELAAAIRASEHQLAAAYDRRMLEAQLLAHLSRPSPSEATTAAAGRRRHARL
jgi:hypothetical protein